MFCLCSCPVVALEVSPLFCCVLMVCLFLDPRPPATDVSLGLDDLYQYNV